MRSPPSSAVGRLGLKRLASEALLLVQRAAAHGALARKLDASQAEQGRERERGVEATTLLGHRAGGGLQRHRSPFELSRGEFGCKTMIL
jgi:hypothetical protein